MKRNKRNKSKPKIKTPSVSKIIMKKKKKKEEVMSFQERASAIIGDKTKSNDILDLLAIAQQVDGDPDRVAAAFRALCRVFRHFLQKRSMVFSKGTKKRKKKPPDEIFRTWLVELYRKIKGCLLDALVTDNAQLRFVSLVSQIKLLVEEDKFPVDPTWTRLLDVNDIVVRLVHETLDQEPVIRRLDAFLARDDFKLLVLKSLKRLLKDKLKEGASDRFLCNVFAVLRSVTLVSAEDDFEADLLFQSSGNVTYGVLQSSFEVVWITFLKFGFKKALRKRILHSIHESVMPYLAKPVLLTDFLLDTYNIGGVFSLLALNGIFFLMDKHNLEFPDFYKRFYSLMEPSVLFSPYFARFFYLADLFLSSTHLPSYLVASFAKRLSRLALVAPPNCLLVLIPFVGNLFIRHPSLEKMIHNPSGSVVVQRDPYDDQEPDPAKTAASESCLWEMQSLQNHFHPAVAKAARFIEDPLPTVEWDISAALEVSLTEMIEVEGKKTVKEDVTVNFERPTGLLQSGDGKMALMWSLD